MHTFILLFLFANISFAQVPIYLGLGDERIEKLENPIRKKAGIMIENPEIADIDEKYFKVIKPPFKEIKLVGKAIGTTYIKIWDINDNLMRNWLVNVVYLDPKKLKYEIEQTLGKDILRTINVIITDDGKILLKGECDLYEDYKKIEEIKRKYPEQVIVEVKEPEDIFYILWKKIGIESISVSRFQEKIFIEGFVPSTADKARVMKIVTTTFPDEKIVDLLIIGSSEMVQVDVKIYEVTSEVTKDLNLDFTNPVIMNLSANPIYIYNLITGEETRSGEFIAKATLESSLKAALTKGTAQLLAKPKLVTIDGAEKAKFLAGGEVGISSAGTGFAKVDWKPYGVTLEIEPKIERTQLQKYIFLKLKAEVSEPDWAHSVGGIPPILTRTVEGKTVLRPNETLLIAGLIKHDKGKKVVRFPILGYIPIIDFFFKSAKDTYTEKELLIFVTPTIVSSRKIPEEYNRLKKQQDEEYRKLKENKLQ